MITVITGNIASPREVSETAKSVAMHTGLKYISGRELSQETSREYNTEGLEESRDYPEKLWGLTEKKAKHKGIIIDHPLLAWTGKGDLKVFLKGLEKDAAKRIALEDKTSTEEALEKLKKIEQEEARRYLKDYGIDLFDLTVFDLVANTRKLGPEGAEAVIRKYLEKMKTR